ncbi:hypothetical protein COBT_001056 [Conglomerata obtusa]
MPKFKKIVAFNSIGLKMDMLEINETLFANTSDPRLLNDYMEFFLQDAQFVTLRSFIIKQVESMHLKYLRKEFRKDTEDIYPLLVFDDSLFYNETLRSTIVEILQNI